MVAVVASLAATMIYRRGAEGDKILAQTTYNFPAWCLAPSQAVSATSSCTHSAQFDKLTDQWWLLAYELRSFAGGRREKEFGECLQKIRESLRVLRETLQRCFAKVCVSLRVLRETLG